MKKEKRENAIIIIVFINDTAHFIYIEGEGIVFPILKALIEYVSTHNTVTEKLINPQQLRSRIYIYILNG